MSRDYGIILKLMSVERIRKTILSDPDNKLTISGSIILLHLSDNEKTTATDLANALNYEKPFITYAVKGLLAENYVSVTRVDGRTVNITITDKGREAVKAIKKRIHANVELVKKEYSKEEFYATVDCVDKLLDIEKKIFKI